MADTKNYGLKGVGNDVQFGKAGGRFVYNTGGSDFRATTDGTTLAHLQVLDPVGDTDAATKLYVDSTAQGLDAKESVDCATTGNQGTYSATAGPLSNGQFTSFAATIDGVTLAEGDRVLVKDQTNPDENGIYVVQATTTTLNRADDFDTTTNVTAGAYVFVEEGTANQNSGWVLQGPDPTTIGTGSGSDLNFVLFSSSSDLIAGNGLVKNGNALDLDFSELTSASVIAPADELIFQDGTVESRITVTNFLNDRDIVSGITVDGIVARTAADTYASRTITASAVAGDEGISIVDGNGVSGNPTIGIDIVGQTNLVTDDVDDADEILLYHSIAGGTEGIGNYAVTASKLKTYMNAGTSSTSITEGNSTLSIADAGAGILTTNIDGTDVITTNLSTTTFQNGNDILLNTTSTLTITDLTNNDVLIAGTGGLVEDSGGNLTFDGTILTVTGAAAIDNINIDGNTISSTAGVDLLITPLAGQQLVLDGTIIVDAGSMTGITTLGFDGVSFTAVDTAGEFNDNDVTLMTSAAVNDRIESFGYSTTTGTVTSSGTPLSNEVAVFTSGTDIDSDSTFTWDATTLTVNELSFAGDTISNNTTDQPIILRPNGTGSIIFQNGSSEEILELNDTVSAVNGLAITAGATGNPAQITTGTGSEANIDIGFLTNGTGVLSVTAGSGNYEDNVTAADDIPNKQYVDDAVASGVGLTGNLDSVTGTVSLTSAATVNIGAATGIPANCTIMSVTLDIDTASDAVTTVTVGDATNGAASYMAATENDPQVLGIYIADGRVANGGAARQATATVATPGSVGSATCIITFRHA